MGRRCGHLDGATPWRVAPRPSSAAGFAAAGQGALAEVVPVEIVYGDVEGQSRLAAVGSTSAQLFAVRAEQP